MINLMKLIFRLHKGSSEWLNSIYLIIRTEQDLLNHSKSFIQSDRSYIVILLYEYIYHYKHRQWMNQEYKEIVSHVGLDYKL